MIKIIDGDLLDATEPVIAHQCNCTTRTAASGVAKAIFARFPFSEVYLGRDADSIPGTYSAHWEQDTVTVANLYSQRRPGKAVRPDDTSEDRLKWFEQALTSFLWEYGPHAVAMPYLIGCGLAGGDWPTYKALLEKISDETKIPFVLYRIK